MVQVDVFWAYGLGASLAVASGKKLEKEPRPLDTGFFAKVVIFLAICWAPTGILLLLRHPSWETMQAADRLSSMSEWLILAFGVTNVTQGILGFWVGTKLVRAGRWDAAQLNWIAAYFGMFFILLYGWDGLGYDRFLYDRDLFAGSPAWTPGAGLASGIGAFFGSHVAKTLYVDGVILLPPFFFLMRRWSGTTQRARYVLHYLLGVFVLGLGGAAVAALTVRGIAWLFGIHDHVQRALGHAEPRTGAHVASYLLGLPLSLLILRTLRGGAIWKWIVAPLQPAPEPFVAKHILLTGAAGAIGAALLKRLIVEHPSAHFTLIDRDVDRIASVMAPLLERSFSADTLGAETSAGGEDRRVVGGGGDGDSRGEGHARATRVRTDAREIDPTVAASAQMNRNAAREVDATQVLASPSAHANRDPDGAKQVAREFDRAAPRANAQQPSRELARQSDGAAPAASAQPSRELAREFDGAAPAASAQPSRDLARESDGAASAASTSPGCTLGAWDLCKPEELSARFEAVTAAHGPVDLLVNCAGVMEICSLAGTSWELARDLIHVDLVSPLRLMDLTAKALIDRRLPGRIINISSMAGRVPLRGCGYYGAAKAGIGLASEIAELDLRDRGIQVLTVYPGPIYSGLESRARAQVVQGKLSRNIPTGEADEIADEILGALKRGDRRLVFPRVYRLADRFVGIASWISASFSPRPLR